MAFQNRNSEVYFEQGATSLVCDTGGVITNKGIINSTGSIINGGTLSNSGTLTSTGSIVNGGTLSNSGTITSTGTITNGGTLSSSGTINNSGTLNNTGTISGSGDIKTNGLLEVSTGGVFSDVTGKWDDLRVPLSTVRVGPVGPPDFSIFLTGTGSTKGVRAYMFDAGSEEQVFFDVQMPHPYKQGTNVIPHAHISPMTTGSGVVRLGLEFSLSPVNGTFSNPVIYYTTVAITGNEIRKHKIANFADIDLTAYTTNPSIMIKCRFFRDAASTKDTYGADIAVHEFDFHYLKDRFGTVAVAGT